MAFCTILSIIGTDKILAQTNNPNTFRGAKSTHSSLYTYTYDYSDMKPMTYTMAKYKKDRVYIKIININRLIFDISGTSQITSIDLTYANYLDSLSHTLSTVTAPAPANDTASVGAGSENLLKLACITKENTDKLNGLVASIQSEYDNSLSENLKNLEKFSNFAKIVPEIITGGTH